MIDMNGVVNEILWRRKASEMPEGDLDDFVKLGGMDWNGGNSVLNWSGRDVHIFVAQRIEP